MRYNDCNLGDPRDTQEEQQITQLDNEVKNLAMMLRRFIWQANKEIGDTSFKVLAAKATELLKQYGLQGSPLRGIENEIKRVQPMMDKWQQIYENSEFLNPPDSTDK